jgi:hypothetical protein
MQARVMPYDQTVLLPLGTWLALTKAVRADEDAQPARAVPLPVLVLLAVAVGITTGQYRRTGLPG